MMTSIAALYDLRNDLEAQRNEALKQMNNLRANGDDRQAHSYDMFAIGLERAIAATNRAIARERQANETHRSL